MLDIRLNKQLPVVSMNFEEVKASLVQTTSKYKGLIVTEDTLKDCKSDKRDLASLRNRIDTYRKDVKREMEQPIKKWENQCKELIGLIKEAELPIDEGIKAFDDRRRAEKKEKALEIIQEAIERHQLNNNYANRLTVLDKYLNLTGSIKAIKDDVELRAESLAKEQKEEEEKKELARIAVKSAIDKANERINTKLEFKDFEKDIEDEKNLKYILLDVECRANLIYKAENTPKEQPKEEKKEEPKPKEEVKIPADLKIEQPKVQTREERRCFVEFRVEHDFNMIQALSRFLQENGYEYEVRSKGYLD